MYNSIDYKVIGQRLKDMRKSRGYTQEQLAEALEYSPGYISQIERGISRPNLDTIAFICNFLQCDITEILTHTNNGIDYLSNDLNELYKRLNNQERRMLYYLLQTYLKEKKK